MILVGYAVLGNFDEMVQIQFPYVSHLNIFFAEIDKLRITYLLSLVNTLYLRNASSLRCFYLTLFALFLPGCNSVVTHEISKPQEVHQNAWDFGVLVNEYRTRMGLPELEWDIDLWRIASRHNKDMCDRSFFSHFNPSGESPFDRLREVYIMYYRAAENLAFGQTTHETVLSNWLNSPEHRINIESSLYTHHAVAYDSIDHHWTHLFINYGYEKPFPLTRNWTLYPRIPPKD